jgi:hypothetical protein
VKKGKYFDVPDGIIAHLTRECGGKVHDAKVVDIASESFGKESIGGNPHSEPFDNNPRDGAKNAADLEAQSSFYSAYRSYKENSPHTRNN